MQFEMSDAIVVSVVLTVVIVPTIAVVGYLLKNLIKGIESKVDLSTANNNAINEKVGEIKISMVQINGVLSVIEKDFERQSKQVNELNQMLMNNINKTIEHGHEINNLKAGAKMILKHVEELQKEVNK